MQKKKITVIKPRYIKDAKGKATEVYLDMQTYNAIIKRIKKFEKIKKTYKAKSKNTK